MRRFLMAGMVVAALVAGLPVTTQAETQPAPAVPVDAGYMRRVDLVNRYFKAVNLDAMMDTMLRSLMPMVTDQMRKDNPNLSEKDAGIVNEAVVEAMGDFMPKYKDAIADLYANSFTEDELTALVTFYETPTGRSITQKMPALTPKSMQLMSQMLPDIIEDMKAKVCAKTTCPKSGDAKSAPGTRLGF